jgi:hypothetical protein
LPEPVFVLYWWHGHAALYGDLLKLQDKSVNPVIAMLHNLKDNRYHPILFLESPLPGPPSPDTPVRHKSTGHHTTGFATREEALTYVRGEFLEIVKTKFIGEPRLCLQKDFPWDGDETPAMVVFFSEAENNETVPLLA